VPELPDGGSSRPTARLRCSCTSDTGRLDWERRGADRHAHDRIVFVCRGGELRYRNMRKFGGVWISRQGRERVTGPLGPDATEVDLERFREQGWLTGARDDRRDPRCQRCGARLRRATVAGRTTVWCPREQR
jgi:formamidopyrimidine-DNA glycosylase